MGEPGQGAGTVGKALDLLDRVAGFGRPVRLSELYRGSAYPKATLYRLLRTLTSQGMLSYDTNGRSYRLGLRLVRLAHAAWSTSSLAPIARPHLDALSGRTGQTVHLAQLDNGHVLYVDKRNAVRPVEMFSQAGKIGPAYCTGVGKALLAWTDGAARQAALEQQTMARFTPATLPCREALEEELARIRAEGVAYDREEHEAGIICVAVPIIVAGARAVGALSVTASTKTHALDDLAVLVPELRGTAARIAADAENWLFPQSRHAPEHKDGAACRE